MATWRRAKASSCQRQMATPGCCVMPTRPAARDEVIARLRNGPTRKARVDGAGFEPMIVPDPDAHPVTRPLRLFKQPVARHRPTRSSTTSARVAARSQSRSRPSSPTLRGTRATGSTRSPTSEPAVLRIFHSSACAQAAPKARRCTRASRSGARQRADRVAQSRYWQASGSGGLLPDSEQGPGAVHMAVNRSFFRWGSTWSVKCLVGSLSPMFARTT